MFSSANNDGPLESLFKSPSFQIPDNQNPISNKISSSKQLDHDPPFFPNFPSPFFDEHELPLNQILPNNPLMAAADNHSAPDHHRNITPPVKKETSKRSNGASKLKAKAGVDDHYHQTISGNGPTAPPARRRNLGAVPRKRTGKKDRHSKICTAQGIRDRRMRLSLQVARKFFDLQDLLGYDKASKTIEWLFNKSKKAIKELTKDHNPQGNNNNNINSMVSDAKSESFLSECEDVSGIEENSNNHEIREGVIMPDYNQRDEVQKPQKTKPNHLRESRDKARARARCRTREKMMIKQLENNKSSPNQNDVHKLGSSNRPFEDPNQDSGERVSPYGGDNCFSSFVQQLADVGTIEKLLGNSSSSATSCPNISDYNHCSAAAVSCCIDPSSSFMGLLGNWEMLSNDRSLNSSHYAVTNQVSLTGDQPSSVYSSAATTPDFPLFHQ